MTEVNEELSRCESLGHQGERLEYEDETGCQWTCDVCGAEWWDDIDPEPGAGERRD